MVKQRFPALDIMRGLTLALMILVNNPGSWSHVYAPLLHADWHGFTPTDFVFPFFLFMVGAALFFSHRSFLQANLPASQLPLKIIKRTLLLFLIGFLLNIFPFTASLSDARILGVLQRIALAYMFAAFIVLYLNSLMRWVIGVVLLVGYWALLQLSSDPYSLEHSIVRQIDLSLLGVQHLWQGKGIAFDPEGLLSTLPSIVNVLLGFEAARILAQSNSSDGKSQLSPLQKLMLLGAGLVLLALVWNLYFPINKSLWTSPFVLLTSGAGMLVLVVLVKFEKTALNPLLQWFTPFGKNPLFIYALATIWATLLYTFNVGDQSLYHWLYLQLCYFFNAFNASLVFAILHVLWFWCIAKFLDLKKITISL